MTQQKDLISEQALLLEYPKDLRPTWIPEKLTFPPDYPTTGVMVLEASLDAKIRPYRDFNPEFLSHLNASETLFTIFTNLELKSMPELQETIVRCLTNLSTLESSPLPSIYI